MKTRYMGMDIECTTTEFMEIIGNLSQNREYTKKEGTPLQIVGNGDKTVNWSRYEKKRRYKKSKKGSKHWTPEEDAKLRELIKEAGIDHVSIKYIKRHKWNKILERTNAAINARIHGWKKSGKIKADPKTTTNKHRPSEAKASEASASPNLGTFIDCDKCGKLSPRNMYCQNCGTWVK